jgi:hypothetical protein
VTWLVPFRGRNESGRVGVNFLFQAGRTSWTIIALPRGVSGSNRGGGWMAMLHIDRHRDTADELPAPSPSARRLEIRRQRPEWSPTSRNAKS